MLRELRTALRASRSAHLAIVQLRLLIGFAFLPAGLKKVLDQPFTDPTNGGPFHQFLHAFHATGFFYQFVGAVQLVCATLLLTQVYSALGAMLALPVITAIAVFCWSTGAGVPTLITVTMMAGGVLTLIMWDFERWGRLLSKDLALDPRPPAPLVSEVVWRNCGLAILLVYLASCLLYGGVYRPRGIELGEPAFYLLPTLPLFPITSWLIESRRRRRASSTS